MSDFIKGLKAEAEASEGQAIKAAAAGRSDMFRVNPYKLKVKPGWNSRDLKAVENQEHIATLARSIADCGVQEPLTVFNEGGNIYLSDGHCRLAATKWAIEKLGAEIRTVPVKTEDRGTDEADRLASQLVRNSGKGLTDLEKAVVFLRLQRMGWNDEQIARRAGMSGPAAVARIIELNELPDEMKKHINDGVISTSQVRDTVKKLGGDAKAAAAVVTQARAKKEAAVAVAPAPAKGKKGAKAEPNVLTTAPKARVTAKDLGTEAATPRNKVAALVKATLDDANYTLASGMVTVKIPLAAWTKMCLTVGHESEV